LNGLKRTPPIRVIVVVRGGCVEDVFSKYLVEYCILDYDNGKVDDEIRIKNDMLEEEIEEIKKIRDKR